MNTAKKTQGTNFAKTAVKRIVQKSAEATGDLIGNKIAHKITSLGKSKKSLRNYRDEPNSGAVGNINYSIKNSKSFDYKTSITRKLEGNNVDRFLENTRHTINSNLV